MKLVDWIKNQLAGQEEEEIPNIIVKERKSSYNVIDQYPVLDPHSRVRIVTAPELGEGKHYFIEEAPISEEHTKTYEKIVNRGQVSR